MPKETTTNLAEALATAREALAATQADVASSEVRATALATVRDAVAARTQRASLALDAARRDGAADLDALSAIMRRSGATNTRAEREHRGQLVQSGRLRRRVEELTLLVAALEEDAKRQRQDDAALAAQEARKVPLVRTRRDVAEIAVDLTGARATLAAVEAEIAALPPRLEAARQRRERAQRDLDETQAANSDVLRELARTRSGFTDVEPDPTLDRRRRAAEAGLAEARERHQEAHTPLVQLEVRESQLGTRAHAVRDVIARLEAEHASALIRDERQPGWLSGLARRVGWAG